MFFLCSHELGGDQKEKRRTYGAQCQDQEAKTATWNVLGSVLSIATEKMLSSASLFHSVSTNLLHHFSSAQIGETAVVPPEATAIVQTSKMELNTHCSKLSAESWKRPWPGEGAVALEHQDPPSNAYRQRVKVTSLST